MTVLYKWLDEKKNPHKHLKLSDIYVYIYIYASVAAPNMISL